MVEAHRLYRGQDSNNFRVGSSPETYSAKIVFLFSSCFCCVCLQAFEWLCPEEVEGLSDVVSPRLQRLLQFARTVPGEMKEGRFQLYNVFAWKRSRIRGSEGRCSPIQMRQKKYKLQESFQNLITYSLFSVLKIESVCFCWHKRYWLKKSLLSLEYNRSKWNFPAGALQQYGFPEIMIQFLKKKNK